MFLSNKVQPETSKDLQKGNTRNKLQLQVYFKVSSLFQLKNSSTWTTSCNKKNHI